MLAGGCGALLPAALGGETTAPGDSPTIAPVAAPTLAAVDRLIADAACTTDADCRSVAVGAKACGGPDAYRAWSIQSTDGAALDAALALHAAARRAQHAKGAGMMSDCALVGDPGARCEADGSPGTPGRCVLRRATRAGLAAD